MSNTIKADFYRLFYSKAFWISQALFVFSILASTLLEVFNPAIRATGFTAVNTLSNTSNILLVFSVILLVLLPGIDLTQKLYKNSLTSGQSRMDFYFSKTMVIALVWLAQAVFTYSSGFLIASLVNGTGSMPAAFLPQFAATIFVQFLCLLGWISVISFVLYLTRSTNASIVSFVLCTSLFNLPTLLAPKNLWFPHIVMDFNLTMAGDSGKILRGAIVALAFIIPFTIAGLYAFRKKEL